MRGVYERTPGVWWINYYVAGQRHREKAGPYHNAVKLYQKRKADAWQQKKLPELSRRSHAFSELSEDALDYSKAHKRSYRDDLVRMAQLTDWFGKRDASTVTPSEIDSKLSGLGLSPATMNRYRSLLSLVYRLGIERGKVTANPVKLTRARRENNSKLRWLSEVEERDLRRVIRKHYPERMPELDIALHTGLRLSEQYNLTWPDVDLTHAVLSVRNGKTGSRHVRLNSVARAAFRRLPRVIMQGNRVFLNRSPRHWFELAVEKAGIEGLTWHSLRHTFASRLVMAGVDIRTVQELMGHKTIGMTMRYSHLTPKHLHKSVEKLVKKR